MHIVYINNALKPNKIIWLWNVSFIQIIIVNSQHRIYLKIWFCASKWNMNGSFMATECRKSHTTEPQHHQILSDIPPQCGIYRVSHCFYSQSKYFPEASHQWNKEFIHSSIMTQCLSPPTPPVSRRISVT